MRVNLADHVDRHIFYWGAYEPIESFLFLSSITPGMTVIDAGANIGQYTVLSAQAVGPGGRVLSFEPSPRNFARLEENVQMNEFRNVQLFRSALWDSEATLSFRFPESGESFQVIEITPTAKDYCIPVPEKCTIVKPVPMGDWIVRVVPGPKRKAKVE